MADELIDSVPGRTCAITGKAFTPCDLGELEPLLAFLARGESAADRRDFQRGTLLPDGRLDLCKQRIGPLGTAAVTVAVRGHPQVRHLLLGANGLGDEGAHAVADLVRHGTLRTVYLGCNFITATGAQQLAEAVAEKPAVTGLWLKRNPIGDPGVRAIADMLPHDPGLRILDLTQTNFSAVGLNHLVDALITTANGVERLYLCGNRIGPTEAHVLARLVHAPTKLRHLYLSVNRLGDDGTAIIANALRANDTLRTLSLASNGIGPAGAAGLAVALAGHSTLRSLELGRQPSVEVLGEQSNRIGDTGAAALAGALPGHPCLTVLDLKHNGITDAGASELIEALAGNRSVIELNLGKGISRQRRQQIDELLERNRKCRPEGEEDDDPDLAVIRSVYR